MSLEIKLALRYEGPQYTTPREVRALRLLLLLQDEGAAVDQGPEGMLLLPLLPWLRAPEGGLHGARFPWLRRERTALHHSSDSFPIKLLSRRAKNLGKAIDNTDESCTLFLKD